MKDNGLTEAEYEKGLVEFHCPTHGYLIVAIKIAQVWCGKISGQGKKCNKRCIKFVPKF